MSTVAPKFRGKSAARSAYITVTGSTYGKDTCFTAGALTRHIAMRKYSDEAVYQAISKLEADGVIEHVGQLKGEAGRANRKYKVLAERDPDVTLLAPGRPRSRRVVKSAPVAVETTDSAPAAPAVPANLTGLQALVSERTQLKARLIDLQARLDADSARLVEVDNALDKARDLLA